MHLDSVDGELSDDKEAEEMALVGSSDTGDAEAETQEDKGD